MSGRTIIGLIFLLVGGGLVLERADIWDFGQVLSTWWPLFIIAVAALQLLTRSAPLVFTVILFGIGVILQAIRLDMLPSETWSYLWPAGLILAGVWLVLSRGRGPGRRDVADDMVRSVVAFGGSNPRVTSKQFRGGSLTALFGGAELDLLDAALAPEGAVLEVTAAFGGVEVAVPEDWAVKVSGLPIFGGWDNKTRNQADPASEGPNLEVRCLALFGGIEVHN